MAEQEVFVMKPSAAIQTFFAEYIYDRSGLILTLMSPEGASVNIDGPFEEKNFGWSKIPKLERGDETVLQPKWALPRDNGFETNVHLHVPWDKLPNGLFVRLWYSTPPTIPQDVRICFFKEQPPFRQRGSELFWFYGFSKDNPLAAKLPPTDGEFSQVLQIGP